MFIRNESNKYALFDQKNFRKKKMGTVLCKQVYDNCPNEKKTHYSSFNQIVYSKSEFGRDESPLGNGEQIDSEFWTDIFVSDCVKKPRDSLAIPTFFALSATKISSPKS